jgi:hypothetical protein
MPAISRTDQHIVSITFFRYIPYGEPGSQTLPSQVRAMRKKFSFTTKSYMHAGIARLINRARIETFVIEAIATITDGYRPAHKPGAD